MSTLIYWFRTDLRMHDHAGLRRVLAGASRLLPVYCHDPRDDAQTPWGFARVGAHRRRFLAATLGDLRTQLDARGSGLLEVHGRPGDVLPVIARAIGAAGIVCELHAAPGPADDAADLRAAGIRVEEVWVSSLLEPVRLPYFLDAVPPHFTPFRQSVENAQLQPPAPLPAPAALPPLPALDRLAATGLAGRGPGMAPPDAQGAPREAWQGDPRSSFPYHLDRFAGGETAARAHLDQYFSGPQPLEYKVTRNRLSGIETSTKFSPWLASGALSARAIHAALRDYEARHGANQGCYAIWFELLWRDFFRFLALREQARRRASGASAAAGGAAAPASAQATEALTRWRTGTTGVALVDAGMRELQATGFQSNRLRQITASYLINELAVDPAAGAAWFAAQLVDFDPYSNDGNWRYIAGTGADPRGGRHFNVEKQMRDHDPDGQFQVLWGAAN